MKTLGRILIILVAFAIVMGITYVVVSGGSLSSSASMPAFERGAEEQQRLQFSGGERPEFRSDGGNEFERERSRGGWIFGWIKNIGILAIIVVLIAVPKSLMRGKSKPASAEGKLKNGGVC